MKNLLIVCCFLTVAMSHAQKYDFVSDSLRLITREELFQKGVPSMMENVYFQDGTKTTWDEIFPYLSKGQLMPDMFVDNQGNYNTLVVYEPMSKTFEEMEPNTQYSFLPDNLRLLPSDELFKKPPPRDLALVFYEDGTPTTLDQVMPLLRNGTLFPKMHVNEKLEYVALVVTKKKN